MGMDFDSSCADSVPLGSVAGLSFAVSAGLVAPDGGGGVGTAATGGGVPTEVVVAVEPACVGGGDSLQPERMAAHAATSSAGAIPLVYLLRVNMVIAKLLEVRMRRRHAARIVPRDKAART
jgi:hypothetical protein